MWPKCPDCGEDMRAAMPHKGIFYCQLLMRDPTAHAKKVAAIERAEAHYADEVEGRREVAPVRASPADQLKELWELFGGSDHVSP